MLGSLSKKVVDRLLIDEGTEKEDYEIYLFGMEQLLTVIIDFLTAILLGVVFGEVIQTVIFVLSFMIMRSYAGGFHASTPFKCYLLTSLTIIIVLSVMKCIEADIAVLAGMLFVASMVIWLLAPVDTENKTIDDVEFVVYRRKTRIVWSIEVIGAFGCMAFQCVDMVECIVYAQVVLAVALVGEKTSKRNENCIGGNK